MADVYYSKDEWQAMKKALESLEGSGWFGSGALKELKAVSKNLQEAQEEIQRLDEDRAISFAHTNFRKHYDELNEDLGVLLDFAKNVGDVLEETIDHPFHVAMDDYVQSIQGLNLSEYTVPNTLGITETQTFHGAGTTQEVEMVKQTITLDDLLQDTNPIGTMMQQEYQAYLELHPEADRLRYTDYTEAVLQTGAFDYQSIRDGQLQTENRVYFGAAVCTIIIGMFFPPVGLALGTILGGVQIVSAANGQDLISGRELSTGEQITRGIFGTVGVLGGLSGLNAFSQNTAFVRGTEPGTLNHYGEMAKHFSRAKYTELNHTAQVMRSMSVAPVLPSVEKVSLTKQTAIAFGEMSPEDASRYNQYWDDVVKGLDTDTRVQLNQWKIRPDADLYTKYKNVYTNPQYFNQQDGNALYPGMNGDQNIDGFVNGEKIIKTLKPGTIIDRYGSNSSGKYFSPEGTSFTERALPPFMENEPYTKYKVVVPLEMNSGKVAPWFDQSGRGIQYLSDIPVEDLVKYGLIEKIN